MTDAWPALKSSLLLSVQQNKVEALHFRARVELARARDTGDASLVKLALSRARAIEKEKTRWGDALALLLRAAGDDQAGKRDRALDRLSRAAALFDETGMQMFAAAARRRTGLLTGGADGEAEAERAEAALRGIGVKNPARMADMLAPGFADAPAPNQPPG
jgi:hypothetical protein